jgi:hypothetical protein
MLILITGFLGPGSFSPPFSWVEPLFLDLKSSSFMVYLGSKDFAFLRIFKY